MVLTTPTGYITGDGSRYTTSIIANNSVTTDYLNIYSNSSATYTYITPGINPEFTPAVIGGNYSPYTQYLTQDQTTDSTIVNNTLNVTGTLFYNDYTYGNRNESFWYEDPTQAKKNRIRANLQILVKSRAYPIAGISREEQNSIETLREMISESDYRKYIKYGFLMVRGSDGDLYQVYRDRSHTKIWHDGKVIEEICVRIKDTNIPPTDNVIAFRTLIQINAEAFKAMGNRFKVGEGICGLYNIVAATNYTVELRQAA